MRAFVLIPARGEGFLLLFFKKEIFLTAPAAAP
jgi:hypothetical protein